MACTFLTLIQQYYPMRIQGIQWCHGTCKGDYDMYYGILAMYRPVSVCSSDKAVREHHPQVALGTTFPRA